MRKIFKKIFRTDFLFEKFFVEEIFSKNIFLNYPHKKIFFAVKKFFVRDN